MRSPASVLQSGIKPAAVHQNEPSYPPCLFFGLLPVILCRALCAAQAIPSAQRGEDPKGTVYSVQQNSPQLNWGLFCVLRP